MKVSVVMAVYNGGDRMRRTIDSVLSQTYGDFEFLCIDDGSTDDISAKILDEYAALDHRMIVIHRSNKGVYDTLNECHTIAMGDYIARIDQDDVFHPQMLEYCVAAIKRYDLDMLTFLYKKIDSMHISNRIDITSTVSNLLVWDENSRLFNPKGYCDAIASVHPDTWAHFVNKRLFVDYPINPGWGRTRPLQRLHNARRWAASNEVLYYYDSGVATSMSHQNFTMMDLKMDMDDLRHMCDMFEDERASGDSVGEWEVVCRVFLIKCLKTTFNAIRRSKGIIPEPLRISLICEFACALHEFFVGRGIPLKYARLRHRLAYLWLMFKCRKHIMESVNV